MGKTGFLWAIIVTLISFSHAAAYEIGIKGTIALEDTISGISANPVHGTAVAVSKGGKSLYIIDTLSGAIAQRISLATPPDGLSIDTRRNRALVYSADGVVDFVDLSSGNVVRSTAMEKPLYSIAVDRNNNYALLGSDSGLIVLDLDSGAVVREILLPMPAAKIVVYNDYAIVTENTVNPDSGEDEHTLTLVNPSTGDVVKKAVYKGKVGSVGIDDDLGIMVEAREGELVLHDLTLQFLAEIRLCGSANNGCKISGIAVNSSTHTAVATDSFNDTLSILDIQKRTLIGTVPFSTEPGLVAIDRSNNLALATQADGISVIKLENPIPRIEQIVPDSARSGDKGLIVSIEGSQFIKDSLAEFDGKYVPTFFENWKRLEARIAPEDLKMPGNVPVSVTNPPPGGGASNTLLFRIYRPAPDLETISPKVLAAGSAVSLRVRGKNFFNGSKVNLNGEDLKTRFISSILLEAEVPQALTTKTGEYPVVVINPSPGFFSSRPQYLSIAEAGSELLSNNGAAATTTGKGKKPGKETGSLKGRILNTNLKPLEGVTIKVRNLRATTDANGSFLLEDVPAGKNVLLIDGSSERKRGGHYPTIPITVDIAAGIVNNLHFQPYLHKQKNRKFKQINPNEDTILTDSDVPGFEMRIPKGVNIIGWDGKRNQKVSVRTVPSDRLPVEPLPDQVHGRTVYMFYFDKIGGGTPDEPIPVKAPNDLGLLPGEKAILWYYDESPIEGEAPNDWAIAGTGTVTQDGRYIVSDPGTGIPKFCCGAIVYGGSGAGSGGSGKSGGCGGGGNGGPGPAGPSGTAGDPVDLATGYFTYRHVDYRLDGIIPVNITRYYRSGDEGLGGYGKGTYFGYDWWIGDYGDMLLLLMPGNYQYSFYKDTDGSYINTTDPKFTGARIYKNADSTYTLGMKTGWKYLFASSRLLVGIEDPNGNALTFLREVEGNVTKILTPEGREITLDIVIRGRDNITKITGPKGTVTYNYKVAGSTGQLESVEYPDGSVIAYEYDADGRMTTITENGKLTVLNEYDTDNRIIRQIHIDGGTYLFNYTTAGGYVTETSMTDPNGNVRTWRFNSNGYITEVTTPDGTTTYGRETGTNRIVSVTDPLGRTVSYARDADGNVASITDNAGNTTAYEYTGTFGKLSKITDALGNVTTFAYDANGNLTTITDPQSNTTAIAYNANGNPVSVTDALNNTTFLEYDKQFNLVKITDPAGNAGRLEYDSAGRIIKAVTPGKNVTEYAYDKAGGIREVIDHFGKRTQFYYTADGNLSMLVDAKGQTVRYTYDDRKRLASMQDRLGRTATYAYDDNDNLVSVTDRKSRTTVYTHDGMNRVTRADYADGGHTTYGYDAVGRLVTVADTAAGTIQYTYSDSGCSGCGGGLADRVVREVTPLGSISYTYDAIGRRTSMTVAGSPTVNYSYDNAGRMTGISVNHPTQGLLDFGFSHDALGRRTFLTYPNGATTNYAYDSTSKITALQHLDPLNAVLESLSYLHDKNGNRASMERVDVQPSLPGPVANTSYNEANQLLQLETKDITYDENGNMASSVNSCGTTTYAWDARNRLVGITGYDAGCSPMTASFKYDALNRRTEKTINGRTVQYLFDGMDIVQEIENNSVSAEYISSLSIDEPLARIKADGTIRYYKQDALGSVIALTDGAGAMKTRYNYGPFGRVTVTGETSDNPFQYTGRENDGTGLYYYRARYYDPQMGRFISPDPIGFAGGINFYAYVQNNPVNWVDPEGLWGIKVSAYWGYGGSLSFGKSNGKIFVRAAGGVGVGGGISYNPNGDIPKSSKDASCNDSAEGFIGPSAWAGASLGPLSGGWAGHAGLGISEGPNGRPSLDYLEKGGFYGSVSPKKGLGFKLGGGLNLVDVGVSW